MDNGSGRGKLKYLLLVGIIAIAVGLGGELAFVAFSPTYAQNAEASPTSQTVLSGNNLTWADLVAQSNAGASTAPEDPTTPAESQPPTVEPSAVADALASVAPASATPEGDAAPTTLTSTTQPPVVLEDGGMVPYDDKYFTVTTGAVEEAGGMKVLRTIGLGTETMFQGISWRLDIPDADLVTGKANGWDLEDKDLVGTGTILELMNEDGEVIDTAVVVVPGDVLGSGQLNEAQLIALRGAVENPETLTGAFFLAGDIDESGEIDQDDVDLLQARLNEQGEEPSGGDE